MSEQYTIYNDDCLKKLDELDEDSIDCIVTDPPYEINFMGKGWDNAGVSFNKTTWEKCLKVLKPGGYLLAFGGSRTYHRIACAVEDAGFELRDTIMWIYGSGMPKALNIGLAVDKKLGKESKVIGSGRSGVNSRAYQSEEFTTAGEYQIKEATNEWNGWRSALKPAFEPIIVARKPFNGTLVDNVLKNGTGGLNIDECRIGNDVISIHNAPAGTFAGGELGRGSDTNSYRDSVGRYPANVILTYGEDDAEEVCGGFPDTKGGGKTKEKGDFGYCFGGKRDSKPMADGYDDSGSAARYFYSAKASSKDRNEGLEEPNTHTTVKPTSLMQYLVRLVAPKGATILDPFMGSGSTGKAVAYENKERGADYEFVGIEKETEYCEIAKKRIAFAEGKK